MKLKSLLSVFTLLLLVYATNASALSIAPLFNSGGPGTLLSDNSAEFLIKGVGSTDPDKIEVGDILVTILGINTVGPTAIGQSTLYNELTALTAVKIATAGDVDLGPAGVDDSFGSQNINLWQYTATGLTAADTALFNWSTLSGGQFTNDGQFFAMVFEDPLKDYNRTLTIGAGIASATNGDLRLGLELNPGNSDFLSVIAPLSLSDFGSVDPVTAIDGSNISIDGTIVYQNWPGLLFLNNITGGNGGVSNSDETVGGFPIYDNVDFTVHASNIPEPATMVLFGLGLLSVAAVGRRNKN